ncbi:MAG: hypothetical protein K8S18_20670, partial [Desulfobacula sp.]|nr:hypothetical protein [Desulfobacula sp.]
MKKLLIILALSIAFLITGTQAWAISWTIDDNYIGGTASGSYVSPNGDVIGPVEFYGISGMDVHLVGDRLTIDIFTNYNYQ